MKSEAESNINKFLFFRFFSRFYFYFPVIIIFFYKHGLTIFETGMLISVYSLTVVVFTMISGTLSNRYGKKFFLVAGELSKAAGMLLLGIGNQAFVLGMGQFFSGLGFATVAGIDSAFLYENYAVIRREDEYRKAEAQSHSILFFAALIAGVIGAWAFSYHTRLPFLLTLPFNIVAMVIALTFKELRKEYKTDKFSFISFLSKLKQEHEVINYIALYASVRAVIMTVFIGLLPLYLFNSVGINISYFGVAFAIYMLVGYYFGKQENKIEKFLSVNRYKLLICLSLTIALVLFAIIRSIAGALIPMLLFFAAGSIRPLAIGNINQLLKNKSIRSEILSFTELVFGILNVIFVLFSFYIYEKYSLTIAFFALLILFMVLCCLLTILELKSFRERNHDQALTR